MKKILVVDDEIGTIESLKAIFYKRYQVLTTMRVEELFETLSQEAIDLLLLDIVLPKDDGLELLKQVRALYPDMPVIMVSAISSTSTIAEAIRLGAVEFITKPFNVKDVRLIAERAISNSHMRRQMEANRREAVQSSFANDMIGEAPAFRSFLQEVRTASMHEEDLLIVGERGTGKEMLTHYIHSMGTRADFPFIKLKCSADYDDALETELFGEVPPEGANSRGLEKLGRIDLAAGGTLYLEDCHLLPVGLQERLGQAIQEGAFKRKNSDATVKTTCRFLLSCTSPQGSEDVPSFDHFSLQSLADKPYLRIPSLRERREDIPLLSYSLVNRLHAQLQVRARDIDSNAMQMLRRYDWPGNTKELKNMIEGILFVHPNIDVIKTIHLPQEIHWSRPEEGSSNGAAIQFREFGSLEERTDAFQKTLIIEALNEARGIKSRAAEILRHHSSHSQLPY